MEGRVCLLNSNLVSVLTCTKFDNRIRNHRIRARSVGDCRIGMSGHADDPRDRTLLTSIWLGILHRIDKFRGDYVAFDPKRTGLKGGVHPALIIALEQKARRTFFVLSSTCT